MRDFMDGFLSLLTCTSDEVHRPQRNGSKERQRRVLILPTIALDWRPSPVLQGERMSTELEKSKSIDEIIKGRAIQFVNLQFTDIMGVLKSVGIPAEQWPDVVDHGLWFDGSSVQ